MKRLWTPARRVWLWGLAVSALAISTAPTLAATCPEVKFGGPVSLNIPDFTSVNGSWVATAATINGQSSSPKQNQGGIYQWTQVAGPAGTLAAANTPQVLFTAPDVGASGATVVLRLTVTGCGGSASDNYTINVTDAHDIVVNAPPHAMASASPASASEGVTVTLDGSASYDPDGDALNYHWTQVGGPVVVLATPDEAIASFTAPNIATTTTLSFSLTVSDGALSSSNDTLVNVLWSNDPPIAVLSCPLEVNEGEELTLDGSDSVDNDNGIASYTWEQLVGLPVITGIETWNAGTATFHAPQLGFVQSGLVPFQLTVTDGSGAQSSAECSVFIHDITPPLISGATDIEAEATSAAGAAVSFALTAADAVDGDLSPLLQCVPPSGSTFAIAITQVTCQSKDSAQNLATASFNVIVADHIAPLIGFHNVVEVEATGPDGAWVDYTAPATSDAVDGDGVAQCAPPPGTFPLDSTVVLCDASDNAGNDAAQTQFTVTVHDTKPPVIDPHPPIGPIEATGPSGAAVTYDAPAANDIVDGAVSVNCTPASGSTFALGVHPVSCSAPDAHGNSAASSFDVNVVDTTPPAISGVGPDLVIEATSGVGATVTYALPSATDLVDGAVAVTCAAPSGSVFALGVHTVNCNAQDAHSNSAGASFTVTVRDTTAPTIAGLFNLVIEATSPAGASASFNPTASDAVDPAVVVSCAPASGSTFALGTHTVACSATDFSDNTAQASFTVTVRDTTPPTIAPHAEVTITGASGSSALVHYTLPEAFDLVSGNVAVNCTPAPDSTFPVGTTAVNCSAADAAGNVATSSFPVTVHYAWTGFFRPIDNLPTVNSAKAGSAIPVKFSLGGNQGMAILAAGYPKSAPMACQGAVQDLVEETVTAGGSSLQYDAAANQYIYIWKTDKSWAGGCRQLQLRLADGTTQVANFTFTR